MRNRDESWIWIWNLKLPPKIKIFIWKCVHNRIPTRAILFPHLNPTNQSCPRCNDCESPIHMLRDCIFARTIWLSFPSQFLIPNFFLLPISLWCKLNSRSTFVTNYTPWNTIFAFTTWSIWPGCNSLAFNNQDIPHQIIKKNALSRATEFYFLSYVPTSFAKNSTRILFSWTPAPRPYISINMDDSSKGNPENSGAGGLARNHDGNWLWGFSLHLCNTNNIMAELWAICEALIQAWMFIYKQIHF